MCDPIGYTPSQARGAQTGLGGSAVDRGVKAEDSCAIEVTPWGKEMWLACTEEYHLKILEIEAGQVLGPRYHEDKMKTWVFLEGVCYFSCGDAHGEMLINKFGVYDIFPGEVHRLRAVTKMRILEVATPQRYDLVEL